MRKDLVVAIGIALVASTGTLVSAQNIVLQQPPNQQSYGISDPDFDRAFAEDFILLEDSEIHEAVLWGVRSDPMTEDSFTIIFHEDSAGLPGDVVASASDLAPSYRLMTGERVGTLPEFIYYVPLPTAVPLSKGIWWVEIFNTTSGSIPSWGWESGDLDPVKGIHGCAIASEVPGVSWSWSPYQRAIMLGGPWGVLFLDGFESGNTYAWSSDTRVVDQAQEDVNYGYWFDDDVIRWQEFIPTFDNLNGVEIIVGKNGDPGGVIVEIATQTDVVLGQTFIPYAVSGAWLAVAFDSPLGLTPGNKYRIRVYSDTDSQSPDDRYFWRGSTTSDYCLDCLTDVSDFLPDYDYAFRTFGFP